MNHFSIKTDLRIKFDIFKQKPDGLQKKFPQNSYWYKIDHFGGEGRAEELASIVLQCSSLDSNDYVIYETGFIDNKEGCRSLNFLTGNEEFQSLDRIYDQKTRKSLSVTIYRWGIPFDRKNEMIRIFKNLCDIDITEYLAKLMTIDFITLNTDRHLNNMGLIYNPDKNSFRPAPIFDNGNSLGVNTENTDQVKSKAFDDNPYVNFQLFGPAFSLDYERLNERLSEYPDCREKEILIQRLALVREYVPHEHLVEKEVIR